MRNIDLDGVLAVGTGKDDGSNGAENFLNHTAFGAVLQAICGAIAIVIALTCLFRAVKSVSMGRPGEGVKVFFWGALVAGMLFNLGLFIVLITQLSGLLSTLIASIGGVIKPNN